MAFSIRYAQEGRHIPLQMLYMQPLEQQNRFSNVHTNCSVTIIGIVHSVLCVQSRLRQAHDQGERRHIRDDIKSLRRELRQRESSAVNDIIRRAAVVLSTLTTVSDDGPLNALDQHRFDVVVIDECSQVVCCLQSVN